LTTLYTPPKPYYNGLLINAYTKELVCRYQGRYSTFVPESTDVMNIGHSSFYWDTGYIRHLKGTADTALYSVTSLDNYWTRTNNFLYSKTSTDSVGIGLSSPTCKLDVNGNLKVRGNSIIAHNSWEIYNPYANGTTFYKEGFNYVTDNRWYYMFCADSLPSKTRERDAVLRVYGKGGNQDDYTEITHDGTNGIITSISGDLILDSYVTHSIVPNTNHTGRLGTPSKYWQATYVDTVFIGNGFYFNSIMIDSITIGTADSLIWWSGSDSWGFKKR
jgi:hypothetical protein